MSTAASAPACYRAFSYSPRLQVVKRRTLCSSCPAIRRFNTIRVQTPLIFPSSQGVGPHLPRAVASGVARLECDSCPSPIGGFAFGMVNCSTPDGLRSLERWRSEISDWDVPVALLDSFPDTSTWSDKSTCDVAVTVSVLAISSRVLPSREAHDDHQILSPTTG